MQDSVASSDQRSSALSLTEAEWQQIVVVWNDTRTDYGESRSLHALFEAQAARTPEASAVVFDPHGAAGPNAHLTYQVLNRRANQLAHHLQQLGVGPEVLVGVCLERSVEMVIGLLGVLKAGGAYVPLDPTYPRDRLAYLLEDVRAPVLLTQSKWVVALPPDTAQVICLDTDWAVLAQAGEENLLGALADDRLAYVIYTSGSTGKPKGVMNTQRGILNRLLWMQAQYHLTEADRVLQKTPFSFDVSVWEFFWPLMMGACLVMAQPGGHKDNAYLIQTIREQHITTLHFVPSMLQMFVRATGLETCVSLKRVLCSGEALPFDVQARFWTGVKAELHNLYGPTEAAVDVTAWACDPASPYPVVPIGRPIANLQIYLLDAERQPVPVGVPGEVYIGGVGLARGYLNRPDWTAERFGPHPFGPAPGARLYRTGDLARYLPDGNLEFLGRLDFQVKVRGFRIELGEIEAALRQHPAIREAVVVAHEVEGPMEDRGRPSGQSPRDTRLVAYVAADSTQLPSSHDLRDWLRQQLPDYMVPAAILRLDQLPFTPSGKLDRNALPLPDLSHVELEVNYVPPRSVVEQVLCHIWAETLRLERVGVHTNFFELGGDSLIAMWLLAHIERTFLVRLPLQTMFEAPTIAQVAQLLVQQEVKPGQVVATARLQQKIDSLAPEETQQASQGTETLLVQRIQRSSELPLSINQEVYIDDPLPGYCGQVLHLKGLLNFNVLVQSLNEVLHRHEIVRATFSKVEGRWVQSIAPFRPLSLPIVDLRALARTEREAKIHRLIVEDALRPFDRSGGLLLRATLLRLDQEEHILILMFDHVVSDGWSCEVLTQEIAKLYPALLAGNPSPLPALPIQYVDFVCWQRHWLESESGKALLTYWKKQFDGLTDMTLPTDHPRAATTSYETAQAELLIPSTLAEALKALSRQESVTMFMALLAVFQVLLHRYSGLDEILVHSYTANRSLPETQDLIGYFAHGILLQVNLGDDPVFRDLLSRTRKVTLEAHNNIGINDFELLGMLFQDTIQLGSYVHFIFYGLQAEDLNLPDLTMSRVGFSVEQDTDDELALTITEGTEGLSAVMTYKPALFEVSTINRLLENFCRLLEGIVVDPQQRISAPPLLTNKEPV